MRLIDRLISLFRLQRIRSRILLGMIVISLPTLLLLGVLSYNISKKTILDMNTNMAYDNLRISSDMADLMFKSLNNLNIAFVMDDVLRNDLRASNASDKASNLAIHSHMQKIMNSNSSSAAFVNSVCLLNLNYEIYCIGRSDDAGKYKTKDLQATIPHEPWFQMMIANHGRVTYIGSSVLEDSDQMFSTVKLFRDANSANGDPIGYLIVNVSNLFLKEVFHNNNATNGINLVIESSSEQANVIYQSDSSNPLRWEEGTLKENIRALEKSGYNISTYENATTDWIFISLTEIKELLKDSTKIGYYTMMIAIIFALVSLIISYFISGGILTPLIQLKKMMIDWANGKKIEDNEFGNDEISVIASTFQKVARENQVLNDRLYQSSLKEKEAELRALQAQINPHFLYNTLDSIYWMAMLEKHNTIAKMAVSLSESFKLSLNKGKETILIQKELLHIQHYITIQNIRYKDRFTYTQQVEESLLGMHILKLVLQPLVENAITHGLEPKAGPGTITLTGKRDGNDLVFIVEDDGIGIADMSSIDQGYGLRNVRERIQLYYGSSSRLDIISEKNKGTTVMLRFNPAVMKGVYQHDQSTDRR